MGALISFLGTSVFRMIWGEISSAWTTHQDHKHEMERMKLQGELDAQQFQRNQEAIKLQHENGITVIRVQSEVDQERMAALTFDKGVEITGKTTGFVWIDAWNAAIRAALATECMILVSLYYYRKDWVLDANGWELCGAALGLYLADRMLFRRGK